MGIKSDSYIDGEFQTASEQFEVLDPSRDEVIALVPEMGSEGVDDALRAAERAQDDWGDRDPEDRTDALQSVANQLRDHTDELADLETLEVGRPISTSKLLVDKAIRYIEYYAGVPTKIEGETIPVPGERFDYTVREPLGVTAHIVPWNVPTLLGLRGIAPALACGNTIVAKPSPEAPLALIRLAELASEAGLPDGVFNVVPGDGPRTGEALVNDDRTDHVTFTGSRETGTQVGKQAMDQVTPVTLELGGKSPSIVFPDADLERVVKDSLTIFSNCGQVCYATTRLFVHKDVYDEFASRFSTAIDSLTVGPGDVDPEVGPLITSDALQTVDKYVTEAVQDGGRLLAGGNRVERPGNFYRPTLLDGVGDDAPISCNEVFGPVVTMYEFGDEREAIRRANDTKYGLYGTVWTDDVARAHRVAHAVDAGTVTVNEYPLTFPQAPFGGYKKSGIGREKGMQVVSNFTRLKNVVVNLE